MVYTARHAAENANAGNGSHMNALARVAFEKHLSDARKHVLAAMRAQAAFWEALQTAVPNLGTIHRILKTLHMSTAAAEHAFKELVTLKSGSLIVLRLVSVPLRSTRQAASRSCLILDSTLSSASM